MLKFELTFYKGSHSFAGKWELPDHASAYWRSVKQIAEDRVALAVQTSLVALSNEEVTAMFRSIFADVKGLTGADIELSIVTDTKTPAPRHIDYVQVDDPLTPKVVPPQPVVAVIEQVSSPVPVPVPTPPTKKAV